MLLNGIWFFFFIRLLGIICFLVLFKLKDGVLLYSLMMCYVVNKDFFEVRELDLRYL